jgi:hypothetical protein
MKKLLVLAAVVGAMAGCNPPIDQGQAFIEGVLSLVPPCTVQAGQTIFNSGALLDIGHDAGSANNLILPIQVRTNLPSTFSTQQASQDQTRSPNFDANNQYGNTDENIITFNQSEVFFSTDEDRGNQLQLGQVAGTPVNRQNQRISTVAGVVFNQQSQLLTPGVVFATVISKGDATLLQSEPFVAGALSAGGINGRAHIILNIRLKGVTTGSGSIETPVFPFPVDLCADCLTTPPNCGVDAAGNKIEPVASDKVCIVGMAAGQSVKDAQALVCP